MVSIVLECRDNDKRGMVGAALVLAMPVIVVQLQVQREPSTVYFIEYH